jgi:transcriptional regulator
MLILQILSLEPAHGYGIAQRLQLMSREAVHVNQGSLYPALHRLEHKGGLTSEWRPSETGREAKFYSLTRAGKARHRKGKLESADDSRPADFQRGELDHAEAHESLPLKAQANGT